LAIQNQEAVSQISSFGSLGILTMTQELTARTASLFPDFDHELVAEESLCIISALTAESVSSVDRSSEVKIAIETLLSAPYSYRDYLFGQMVLRDDEEISEGYSERIGQRIDQKMHFYASHLSSGLIPTPAEVVQNIMILWMGKISPPGRQDSAADRLDQLDVLPLLQRHVTLMASFASHCLGG